MRFLLQKAENIKIFALQMLLSQQHSQVIDIFKYAFLYFHLFHPIAVDPNTLAFACHRQT